MTDIDPVKKEILEAIWELQKGYYIWFSVYIVFLVAGVLFPGIAAMGVLPDPGTKIFAGIGTLFIALTHALKPHEYATAYDAGVQLCWKVEVAYVAKTMDDKAVSEALQRAIDMTTFKYTAPPSTGKPTV